jgi:hypothetical protein
MTLHMLRIQMKEMKEVRTSREDATFCMVKGDSYSKLTAGQEGRILAENYSSPRSRLVE